MNQLAQTLGADPAKCSEHVPAGNHSPELPTVSKLLLNAWTAEYHLRLKPIGTDREYLNRSLNWTFPQAYYAVLFSVRAVLASDGIKMANEDELQKLIDQWAKAGADGPAFTQSGNPFDGLTNYRISSICKPTLLSGPEAAALHVKLIRQVDAANTIHETYIRTRLGAYTYAMLINSAPEYLRKDFVSARAQLIFD